MNYDLVIVVEAGCSEEVGVAVSVPWVDESRGRHGVEPAAWVRWGEGAELRRASCAGV